MILLNNVVLSSTFLIIGAILAVLGFIGYLFIVINTKKKSPEEFLRKFRKNKPLPKNASSIVDLWGAITMGVAVVGLLLILVAVFVSR